ncbi:hypothetical protein P153DRAFT_27252 [Dothidotthia symphoricarpi CBS 119687]|uniref:Uncharacterized protein n=1 Tax=Dothidotthia symphoricarpi CBS 119687 TaxID=1392245 RepID=A0A6A6AC93_9PLEO|nr:uncharacterized protein P153DRAFT_27252 [Dothidotthia symphoricarpi CBS 119687]KAF2128853.1 hypothetical protein P153DRAFT_27252 [Dothidotthia symphoricarpi CBS 119687]
MPPPPPTPSPFDLLPAELLLTIHQYLSLSHSLNLALAIYPTLRRHGLAPALTPQTVLRITRQQRSVQGSVQQSAPQQAVARLPVELFLQIAEHLEPGDGIAMVFALDARFYRGEGGGGVSAETGGRLRVWGRRE